MNWSRPGRADPAIGVLKLLVARIGCGVKVVVELGLPLLGFCSEEPGCADEACSSPSGFASEPAERVESSSAGGASSRPSVHPALKFAMSLSTGLGVREATGLSASCGTLESVCTDLGGGTPICGTGALHDAIRCLAMPAATAACGEYEVGDGTDPCSACICIHAIGLPIEGLNLLRRGIPRLFASSSNRMSIFKTCPGNMPRPRMSSLDMANTVSMSSKPPLRKAS
mmetsp:Transcript_35421/g.81704  ORF Transcript_35421/g.81704 Transcript_35421/m.81704 type:complete len:227 (-) Transcript_35421:288-968(-)